MKVAYKLLFLVLALLLFDCSNKGTEPGDELPKYENKLEFLGGIIVDTGWIYFPTDFISGGYPILPRVTIHDSVKDGSIITLYRVSPKNDSMQYSSNIVDKTKYGNNCLIPRIRNPYHGFYSFTAYLMYNGVTTEFARESYTVGIVNDKTELVSIDKNGDETIKDTFKTNEKITPKIIIEKPLAENTYLHIVFLDSNQKVLHFEDKNINSSKDLEWYFEPISFDYHGRLWVNSCSYNKSIPKSWREIKGGIFTITKD